MSSENTRQLVWNCHHFSKVLPFPGLSASSPSQRGHTGVARNLEARFLSWDWRHGRESCGEHILLNQTEQRLENRRLMLQRSEVLLSHLVWSGEQGRSLSQCGLGLVCLWNGNDILTSGVG